MPEDSLYSFPSSPVPHLCEWPGSPVGSSKTITRTRSRTAEVPESLREEFELFRVMHQAAHCCDLNTTLQRDSEVSSKRQAVVHTLDVIARTLDDGPRDIHLTLDNYKQYIRSV